MADKEIIKFYTDENGFAPELLDVAKLFFSRAEFVSESDNTIDGIVVQTELKNGKYRCRARVFGEICEKDLEINPIWTDTEKKRYKKRLTKTALYDSLKKYCGAGMPWGSLTGIRPTKLAYEFSENGNSDFRKIFAEKFDVSEEKISLVESILENQKGLRVTDDNAVDVYVGIPFCTSRCSYCSFTSGVISKLIKHVQPYVDNLIYEIDSALSFLSDRGYKIRNVYFGGGTPTSLAAGDLDRILSRFHFKTDEFTVEAGRPDTIDREKLQVLKNRGVNRVSINPQTFNQITLDKIGRSHTVEDIIEKYSLAREFGFIVNMDLIAGLPDETADMFRFSVDKAVSLAPDNVTVHTLALKKGSRLKEQDEISDNEKAVKTMVDYARKTLESSGYEPYYLYRQKYVSANLENVGYCKAGRQCRYNIDIMEETTSIAACGCNAISKRIFSAQNRIERQANPKDVITYNSDLNLYLERKMKLFDRRI